MNENQPWVAHGSETDEHEDFLIGNRAGLEALKSAVEGALRDGEWIISEPKIEFTGIRVMELDPREAIPVRLRDKFYMAGCLVVLVLCVLVFLVGLFALPALFR
jgi:hypothetical protein